MPVRLIFWRALFGWWLVLLVATLGFAMAYLWFGWEAARELIPDAAKEMWGHK